LCVNQILGGEIVRSSQNFVFICCFISNWSQPSHSRYIEQTESHFIKKYSRNLRVSDHNNFFIKN